MEPASLLIVCTTYVGTLVARKCPDDAVDALLEKIKARFRKAEGRELTAADATNDAMVALLSSSELKPLLDAFFDDSKALQRAVNA